MRWTVILVLGLALVGAPAAHGSGSPGDRGGGGSGKQGENDGVPEIRVVSNRADLVSGGDALVEVTTPRRARAGEVRVWLNGRDITGSFKQRPGGRLLGVVDGLRVGRNDVTARVVDERDHRGKGQGRRGGGRDRERFRGAAAQLRITNHSLQGPLIAGPQVQPWICATEQNGLGPARDESCSAPTRYEFLYKSSATGQFLPYDPKNPPADVAQTTTDQGRTVPYVVRRERGVIDRGIYDIAVLFDPGKPWDPTAPQQGWNGKVLWPFGGDCQPNHVQPAPGETTVLDDKALSRGFAVGSSGLNILGRNCNDVVSAEAMMMVKERLIDQYGPVRYTIGAGCSGGSMQVHWLSANYPGLLDGILPSCSYPDIWDTLQEAEDCSLLNRQFAQHAAQWTVASRTAVTGHADPSVCLAWAPGSNAGYDRIWLDPDNGPACLGQRTVGETPPWVYNAQTNPDGERCTLPDYQVALLGTRREDGFANRPYDNVGVQYGFDGLQSGAVSPEQFVDLNASIGGYDIDWNWQPRRSQADPGALRNAYRGGRITYARQLAKVPILDLRATANVADIHTDVHSYITRARLDETNGHHANQLIWTTTGSFGDPTFTREAFLTMDRWLAAIEADDRRIPLEHKVVRNKPADAVDACWIAGQKVTDRQQCDQAFPYYGLPRIAAGGPRANDIIKCSLEPLRRSAYNVVFTNDQWRRLQATFPRGVCDYRRPGVDQRPSIPWLTYESGPGGQPLGEPPASAERRHW